MKKLTYKFGVLLLLLAVTLSFSGCNLLNLFFEPDYRDASQTIKFSDYNQTQMQSYIEAFLEKRYGIDFEVEDVAEILEGPFYISTDVYCTVATSENGDEVMIWTDINGNIIDDYFFKDMKDEITQLFEPTIVEMFPECVIDIYTYFNDTPSKIWTEKDDVKDFLQNEPTKTCIRIFVDPSADVTKEKIDELDKKLCFCHGLIEVFVCQDLETIDIEHFDDEMAIERFSTYIWNEEAEQQSTSNTGE